MAILVTSCPPHTHTHPAPPQPLALLEHLTHPQRRCIHNSPTFTSALLLSTTFSHEIFSQCELRGEHPRFPHGFHSLPYLISLPHSLHVLLFLSTLSLHTKATGTWNEAMSQHLGFCPPLSGPVKHDEISAPCWRESCSDGVPLSSVKSVLDRCLVDNNAYAHPFLFIVCNRSNTTQWSADTLRMLAVAATDFSLSGRKTKPEI